MAKRFVCFHPAHRVTTFEAKTRKSRGTYRHCEECLTLWAAAATSVCRERMFDEEGLYDEQGRMLKRGWMPTAA